VFARLFEACCQEGVSMWVARLVSFSSEGGLVLVAQRLAGAAELRSDGFHFPVEDYLQHQGRRFATRFDAQRFLDLSESIDLHDVAPERIRSPATLIGFPSDRLVPLADLCELQRRLQGPATLAVVESPYGHDGFLKESEQLAPLLREALA
jgi:homoserine O-acetyltransferase